jgi:integrase
VASVLIAGSSPKTVEDAVPGWRAHMAYRRMSERTIRTHELWIRAWAAHGRLLNRELTSIRLEDLDGWINADGDNKLGSRKVMLSALKSFCRFCQDSGWMPGNPANLILIDMSKLSHAQKETLKRPCFTDDEIHRLIRGTAPGGLCEDRFWHAAIVIARYTGLRMGDISCLEWDSLDLDKNTLSVWTQKRDRRVELPLEPEILRDVLAAVPRQHPQYLFNYQKGINNDVAHRHYLSVGFARIARALSLPGTKTFHCLRASYITDCNLRGIPIEHIARSVGHSNTDVTWGYVRSTAPLP